MASKMDEYPREVLRHYIQTLETLQERLDERFQEAVDAVLACEGQIVVTGMGKPGKIAMKISATFASYGTPSIYLHPAEALHGDLGRVRRQDLILAFSNSGETEEILRLIPPLKKIGAQIVAVTGNRESPLARHSDITINLGPVTEACPMRLAPTASTLAMLALGDALALSVLRRRDFGPEEYALYHPAGSLGRSLLKVGEIMRTGEANPTVRQDRPAREGIVAITEARAGAVSIVDGDDRLIGILTDGDIRRHFQNGVEWSSAPVKQVMTASPKTIGADRLAAEAARIMKDHKIDELPVVDDAGKPVGMLDVQELLAIGLLLSESGS
ncbi:MAG: KpsF/GutQ family sugar-phosphate isomerase [Planctomycetota bacterium]|nr:KpsF/GutQ family sugar-phosphate isomerase [Planctomycetota bacterium]